MGKLERLEQAAEKWLAEGRFTSMEDLDETALSLLQEYVVQAEAEQALEARIRKSIAQLDRGESTRYHSTEELLADIRKEVMNSLENEIGHSIRS